MEAEVTGSLRSKWQSSPGRSSEERWGDLMRAVGERQKDNPALVVSWVDVIDVQLILA